MREPMQICQKVAGENCPSRRGNPHPHLLMKSLFTVNIGTP